MHKSPTATELERYNPDMGHEPVTARSPQTLNRISALQEENSQSISWGSVRSKFQRPYHREWRATPTKRTAHKTRSMARIATVPGHRINSHWSPFWNGNRMWETMRCCLRWMIYRQNGWHGDSHQRSSNIPSRIGSRRNISLNHIQADNQLLQCRQIRCRLIKNVRQFDQLWSNFIRKSIFQNVRLISHRRNDVVHFSTGRQHLQQAIV